MTAEATPLSTPMSEAVGPYFGRFGGRFVPETLVAPIEALTAGLLSDGDEVSRIGTAGG